MKVKYIRKDTKVLTLAERKKPPSSSWSPGGQGSLPCGDIKKKHPTARQMTRKTSPSARIFSTVLVPFCCWSSFSHCLSSICIYSFFYFMSTEKIWDQLFLWFSTTTPSLQTLNLCHPRSHVGKMFWHTPSGRIPRSIQGLSFLSKW